MPVLAFFFCILAFHGSQANQAVHRAAGEGRPNPTQSSPVRQLGAERAADVVALRNALLSLQGRAYPAAGIISLRGTLADFRIVSHERLPDGSIRAVVEFRPEPAAPPDAPADWMAPPSHGAAGPVSEAAVLTGYLNNSAALDRQISDCRRRLAELRAWRESAGAAERGQIAVEMSDVSRALAAAWHDRSELERNTMRLLEPQESPATSAPVSP